MCRYNNNYNYYRFTFVQLFTKKTHEIMMTAGKQIKYKLTDRDKRPFRRLKTHLRRPKTN